MPASYRFHIRGTEHPVEETNYSDATFTRVNGKLKTTYGKHVVQRLKVENLQEVDAVICRWWSQPVDPKHYCWQFNIAVEFGFTILMSEGGQYIDDTTPTMRPEKTKAKGYTYDEPSRLRDCQGLMHSLIAKSFKDDEETKAKWMAFTDWLFFDKYKFEAWR